MSYGNGNLYRGEFINGLRDGLGMLVIMATGTSDAQSIRMPMTPAIYVGAFKADHLNGKGAVVMGAGGFYGTFTDNIFMGTAPPSGPYGHYDIAKVFHLKISGTQHSVTVDLRYLDQIVADLSTHTNNYPPNFDTPDDLARARRDVKALSDVLNTFVPGPSANTQILLRTGVLNGIGHGLDIPGTASRAVAAFNALLQRSPDDAQANYAYGRFLISANRAADAIAPLEKANLLDPCAPPTPWVSPT